LSGGYATGQVDLLDDGAGDKAGEYILGPPSVDARHEPTLEENHRQMVKP